jgi:hypothetical protein
MFKPSTLVVALALSGLAGASFAQSLDSITQRDVNQETRIRNGLQDGQLNTREASLLQREEGHVDRMEANALKDGKLSTAERQRIEHAENKVSRDIHSARSNDIRGNPLSDSSQRMQQTTQRDINQETRIEHGIQQGQLTNREAGWLEHGQARVDGQEFRAGRDGRMSAGEARHVNHAQNVQSSHIHDLRHNGVQRQG